MMMMMMLLLLLLLLFVVVVVVVVVVFLIIIADYCDNRCRLLFFFGYITNQFGPFCGLEKKTCLLMSFTTTS